MRSIELSWQQPYASSFRANIHACGGAIAGLFVASFVWTTGYIAHSDMLESIVSPIFAM